MAYRKYMFDLDFSRPAAAAQPKRDEPEEAEAPEPVEEPPPPPMFSEEELNLARDAAFEEGRQYALHEAAESIEQLTAQALAALAQRFETAFRQQEEANDANAKGGVRVAMAVLRKMLPAACEKHAFDEVAKVVEEVVVHILDEPRIIVRVAESLVEPVRERVEAAAAAQGFEGRVVVQADPRLVPGDARVEWTDGGAERDQARLMEDIEAAVERALAPPERRAGHEADASAEMAGI